MGDTRFVSRSNMLIDSHQHVWPPPDLMDLKTGEAWFPTPRSLNLNLVSFLSIFGHFIWSLLPFLIFFITGLSIFPFFLCFFLFLFLIYFCQDQTFQLVAIGKFYHWPKQALWGTSIHTGISEARLIETFNLGQIKMKITVDEENTIKPIKKKAQSNLKKYKKVRNIRYHDKR